MRAPIDSQYARETELRMLVRICRRHMLLIARFTEQCGTPEPRALAIIVRQACLGAAGEIEGAFGLGREES